MEEVMNYIQENADRQLPLDDLLEEILGKILHVKRIKWNARKIWGPLYFQPNLQNKNYCVLL